MKRLKTLVPRVLLEQLRDEADVEFSSQSNSDDMAKDLAAEAARLALTGPQL